MQTTSQAASTTGNYAPTMKHLTILRHAKAERPEGYPTDLERPLTARGRKDTANITGVLHSLEPPIDWIVCSPSVRTRETAALVVDGLDFEKPIAYEDAIYEASADALLEVLSRVPPEVQHALIIGHNPGLQELTSGLAAGSTSRLNLELPTTGMVNLGLEIAWWNQIRWGCGQLQLLLRPKLIRR
jgi:phosphohistidine phosphatase